MRQQILLLAMAAVFIAGMCANTAIGQTDLNAVATGNWVDFTTWDSAFFEIPTETHDAQINNNYTVYINTGDAADSFRTVVGDNVDETTGTLTISGGTLRTDKMLSLGGFEAVGGSNGTGILNQSGGDILIGDIVPGNTYAQLVVGHKGTSHGIYNLSGGTIDAPQGLSIAHVATSTGEMHQTGGQVTLGTDPAQPGHGYFNVGNSGVGEFSMTAGSITMYTQPFYVGYAATGNGTVDQSGGTITAINLLVGRAGVADYDMSGGAITVAENAWIAARSAAQGIFSLSGDADVQITGNLNVCPAVGDDGNAPTGASGTLNIVGESVTITVGGNLVATGATVTDPEEIWVNESLFNFTTGATDDVSTISVTGTADIDGAVFDIIETGSAGDGTILDLISTGGGISNFATATVGPTATGIWALQLGGASDEILQAVKLSSAHIPGDATGNGIVDDEDAQRLATNWGTNGSEIGWSQGDFDGDNIVGPKDASIMAANWGFGTGGEASAVPEPSTLVLMLGTLCLLLARRRSR